VMASVAASFLDDDDGTGLVHKMVAPVISIRRPLQPLLPAPRLRHLCCGKLLPIP
jgi:hypothetical protein